MARSADNLHPDVLVLRHPRRRLGLRLPPGLPVAPARDRRIRTCLQSELSLRPSPATLPSFDPAFQIKADSCPPPPCLDLYKQFLPIIGDLIRSRLERTLSPSLVAKWRLGRECPEADPARADMTRKPLIVGELASRLELLAVA